ncbi:MAG: molybdenum cofactor guanylyltransferase, partial [Pyrinomonadaceae bacterium]
ARRAVVVSCDLPFVTGELYARLVSLCGDEFDAVAPVQEDGRPQPLCAVYAREPCLRIAERQLASGDLRPRDLLRRVRTRWVGAGELSALSGADNFFHNVNTPQDYESAQALARDESAERERPSARLPGGE